MTTPNAAICLIGDELLSGRTRDINVQQIAGFLRPFVFRLKRYVSYRIYIRVSSKP